MKMGNSKISWQLLIFAYVMLFSSFRKDVTHLNTWAVVWFAANIIFLKHNFIQK